MHCISTWLWLVLLALPQLGTACPATRQSQTPSGTRYTIYSHNGYESGGSYSSTTGCNWEVAAPESGQTWRVTFDRIELETSNSVQRCKYDNLTVKYVLKNQSETRVMCGVHSGLVLVTDSAFSLLFQTDSSVNMRGFKIHYEAISRSEANRMIAAGRISQVFLNEDDAQSCDRRKINGTPKLFMGRWYNTSIIYMSTRDLTYLHNADCSWTLPGENQPIGSRFGLYITFEQVQLEGQQGACALDNLTVTYQLFEATAKRRVFCRLSDNVTLVTRYNVLLELRTDSSVGTGFNVTWFVAPYTDFVTGPITTSQEFLQEQCPPLLSRPSGASIRLYYYPPLTYEPGMRCLWNVDIPPGKIAEFRFHRFQLGRRRYRISDGFLSNYTENIHYCSAMDDTVAISFLRFYSSSRPETISLCAKSVIRLGQVAATSVGSAAVTFTSNDFRNKWRSQGFVLEIFFKNQLTGHSACPKVRQLDNYKRLIALGPDEQPNLHGIPECVWTLAPRDPLHLMALKLSMDYPAMRSNRWIPNNNYRHNFEMFPSCSRQAIISSNSKVDLATLFNPQSARYSNFRETFCSTPSGVNFFLFNGEAQLTVRTHLPGLILSGFNVTVLDLPKPRPGCSTVNISTKYLKDKAFKIFDIKAKAGCVMAESIKMKGFSDAYANTLLKTAFNLRCSNQRDSSLEIISEKDITTVPCGGAMVLYSTWSYPLVLKFPEGTDAQLISNVTYNFPVVETMCQNLNHRDILSNNSNGYIQLPLFFLPNRLPITRNHYSHLACHFELPYRPGFSLLLRISHNLEFNDIDFYCHSKLASREMNPHIELMAKQRDPDISGAWIEQQLEMCHGYSVGTLSTKSELLVDGSVTVNLLSMQTSWNLNSGRLRIYNLTRTIDLSFLISYEYVPSCPELQCRSLDPTQSDCGKVAPSSLRLTAELAKMPYYTSTSECKWNIPINSEMRDAMARQSNHWLARVELSNFAFACPCHDCDTELQHMTIGHKPVDDSPGSDKLIICGDYRTKSKVVHLALTQSQPDIQIAYSALQTGINVSVTFIDCRQNTNLRQCQMATSQVWGMKQVLLSGRTPVGLVFLAVLLALMLIACLLYINRAAVSSRVRAAIAQQRLTRSDDTLQLTHDAAE